MVSGVLRHTDQLYNESTPLHCFAFSFTCTGSNHGWKPQTTMETIFNKIIKLENLDDIIDTATHKSVHRKRGKWDRWFEIQWRRRTRNRDAQNG